MIVMFDVTSSTVVGPFETEEEAVQFKLDADAEINDNTQSLDLYEVVAPVQWMLDNFTTYVPVEGAFDTNIAPNNSLELA